MPGGGPGRDWGGGSAGRAAGRGGAQYSGERALASTRLSQWGLALQLIAERTDRSLLSQLVSPCDAPRRAEASSTTFSSLPRVAPVTETDGGEEAAVDQDLLHLLGRAERREAAEGQLEGDDGLEDDDEDHHVAIVGKGQRVHLDHREERRLLPPKPSLLIYILHGRDGQ